MSPNLLRIVQLFARIRQIEVCLCIARIHLDRGTVLFRCLLGQTRAEQEISRRRVELAARYRGQTRLQKLLRLSVPAMLAEKGRQPNCGVMMPRLNLERSPKGRLRCFGLALRRLRHPQIGPGIGILRTQLNGPLELGQGLRVTAECEQRGPTIIAVDGPVGHPRDCPPDQFQGLFMPSLLLANDAQEMQRASVSRLRRKDLQVSRLRLRQLAVLVKSQSFVELGYGLTRRVMHHFFTALSAAESLPASRGNIQSIFPVMALTHACCKTSSESFVNRTSQIGSRLPYVACCQSSSPTRTRPITRD